MLMCCLLPLWTKAQNKEINFQTFENWQQVLAKAKAENKTIFVDAYATWCGPCKMMDKEVYTNPKVAEYVNANFIAIKVQMDQAKNDLDHIKGWYADATKIQKKYQIEAMPAFLFLDAAGKQVYRGQGYQHAEAFLAFLKTANDPLENYSVKVDKFKKGMLRGDDLLCLAMQAKKYHDDSLAVQIAGKFKKTVIDHIEPAKLLNPELLDYLASFCILLSVSDPITRFMISHPLRADSLLGKKGFSLQMTDFIIGKDEINPILYKNNKITDEVVNWEVWDKKLSKEYGTKGAQRLLIGYKTEWYRNKADWDNFVKYSIEKQEINGVDTSWLGRAGLNNLVYFTILKYSDNPVYLNKALDYMHLAIGNNQNDDAKLDTYANVLYKLGKKEEALAVENRALSIAEKRKDSNSVKVFRETIEKMQGNLSVPIVE
ncbi:Protein of unknown function, DUF255 [Chitinophaga sp. YR573]|nr:Protein of unknown function, DUF255 [Chitinophaga sp. YR573]